MNQLLNSKMTTSPSELENGIKINLQTDTKPAYLTWSKLRVVAPKKGSLKARFNSKVFNEKHEKTIISNVNGIAKPFQVLAIMGASGSGKTTLMNVLNFRNRGGLKIAGEVRLNGKLLKSVEDVSTVAGYVQQDELFIGYLTVHEHLIFQSMLRIDSKVPKHERLLRVEQVMYELNLKKCQNTMIGIFGRKGISGGEKRRLSFASELLQNPKILLCDEPTSGLDSYMAVSIIECMRNLAKKGKTIICTIHQPNSEIYEMFDRLCLLAEGRLAYLGPITSAVDFFTSLGYPLPQNYNPADHFIKTLAVVPHNKEKCLETIKKICNGYEHSQNFDEIKTEINAALQYDSHTSTEELREKSQTKKPKFFKTAIHTQLRWLLWRDFLGLVRSPFALKIQIFQTLIVAIMFGLIYLRLNYDQQGVMDINGFQFLLICNQGFSTMFFVVNVFPVELPIFYREHENGMYRVISYYISKSITDMPNFFVLPIVFVSIVYWMANLNPDPTRFIICIIIVILVVQCSLAFGTLISVASPTTNVALALSGPVLVPLMIFSGFVLNFDSIPKYFLWLRYLSWFGYANELLIVNQWDGVKNIQCPPNSTYCSFPNGQAVISYLKVNKSNYKMNFGLLIALIFFWRILAYVILVLKTKFYKK